MVRHGKTKAEEALRERQAFIEHLVESLQDGLSVVGPDGVRIMVNQALVDMTGFSREELLFTPPPFAIWPPEHREEIGRAFNAMLAGTLRETEFVFMRKNGERFPVLLTPSYMRNEKGVFTHFIISIKDITERKRMEEKLKTSSDNLEMMVRERTAELDRARADLFASAKLSAMGRLAAGVAHQLNSPLGGGMLLAECLADRCRDDVEMRSAVLRIRSSMERMRDVITCMLSLAMVVRKGQAERVPVDLNAAIEAILGISLHDSVARSISVDKRLAPRLPSIMATAGELDQVFLNLINNAIDAMPSGGTLTVETRALADAVEAIVADTGEGISPEHLDQIFEPFFTTRLKRHGLGLGLSIVHEIVQRYGGTIEVESRVERGTTFTVRLPVAGAGDAPEGRSG